MTGYLLTPQPFEALVSTSTIRSGDALRPCEVVRCHSPLGTEAEKYTTFNCLLQSPPRGPGSYGAPALFRA
jgi:hypothetical protein